MILIFLKIFFILEKGLTIRLSKERRVGSKNFIVIHAEK